MKVTHLIVLIIVGCCLLGSPLFAETAARADSKPFMTSEFLFPLEHWHNHSSSVVELPNGELMICWFHGSGERTADDVVILGARKKGKKAWSRPFLLEDVPGYPDTNATLFVDPEKRLWLLWPTILAGEWHTALMKMRISTDYMKPGTPKWEISRVLHLRPEDKFAETVDARLEELSKSDMAISNPERAKRYFERNKENAHDKFYRRLGWMTRAHPVMVDETRMIVPLYSDGFSFSLMAITDDLGKTWTTSTPLVGLGNIQPSLAKKKDGSLVAYMRDAGPPPKRLQMAISTDRGETWGKVTDSELPNPGAGAEVLVLKNGNWVLIYNDQERGRYSLAVSISEDEGQTWKWTRHLERDENVTGREDAGSYHYPTIIQAKDGTLHASYSYFEKQIDCKKDSEGRLLRKSIKHAHFNEAWIREGN